LSDAMMRLLPLRVSPYAGTLCCVLLMLTSGVALAQTNSPADSNPASAESSAKNDDMPPGGCKPIGLTVSGEVVFPLQCKEFIERQRAVNQRPAAAEAKPAAAEAKPPAAEEKPAVAEEKPAPAAEKPTAAAEKPAVAEKSAVVEDKPAIAKDTPVTADEKPTGTVEKPAPKPSEDAALDDSQPATKPGEAVPLPKRADRRRREHAESAAGCTHYRTYNPAAGTYRGFDGRTRPCP
jgi:hypothetical protein